MSGSGTSENHSIPKIIFGMESDNSRRRNSQSFHDTAMAQFNRLVVVIVIVITFAVAYWCRGFKPDFSAP